MLGSVEMQSLILLGKNKRQIATVSIPTKIRICRETPYKPRRATKAT